MGEKEIRISNLTTAADLTGEEFLAVDDGSADGTTQKTGLNDVSDFIQQKYNINQKLPYLTEPDVPNGTSINDLSSNILLTNVTSVIDIPENILPYLNSWILIITFKFGSNTGVQFITSLFNSTEDNRKIFKRHLASGVWSDFVSIF